ncbi:hypothetical protein MPSEU_001098800 [Mayamaea pseudoterrestris]|nr:hypothetical protein MPSEU_001098800 [Mayamaea pseudoterrestris]
MRGFRALVRLGVLVVTIDAWISSTRPRQQCNHAQLPWTCLQITSNDDYTDFNSGAWKPGRPPLRRPIRASTTAASQEQRDGLMGNLNQTTSAAPLLTAHEQAMQDPTLLSSTNASEVVQSPQLLRSLREAGIQQLTRVQQQAFQEIRDGKSLCARSKTGSGKTLAFLLPVLDKLLSTGSINTMEQPSVLILVPTRELGLQITEQVKALLVHCRPEAISVMSLSGGTTSLAADRRMLSKLKGLPDIIVATPGRLLDLITEQRAGSSCTTRVRGRKFSDILGGVKQVILDEADRLILEGFQKETTRILSVLPRVEKRQTLLFSATVSDKMKELMTAILPREFALLDCVENGDSNERIERSFLQVPSMDCYTTSLIKIVRQAMRNDLDCHKILVFFPTARLVRFFANLFKDVMDIPVLEIHSRMSQSARNKARNAFTRATQSVMFTSDVSARGMCLSCRITRTASQRVFSHASVVLSGIDYPDVTLVVQFGAPFNTNLNTHRIGRTARAGRTGKALLVTLPFETKSASSFARKFGYMKRSTDYDIHDDGRDDITLRHIRGEISKSKGLRTNAESAYISFLAYYCEYSPNFVDAKTLRRAAEAFAAELGFVQLPELPERLQSSLDKR